MKTTDKLLIGIVVGIVLLIVAALVVTLTRPVPGYQAEDTPEGVVANYLFALQQKDYQRAYGYLSPTVWGYPKSVNQFTSDINKYSYKFRFDKNTTLNVKSTSVTDNNATVTVHKTRFQSGNIFDTGQSYYVFDMKLTLRKGEWEIVNSTDYFIPCWDQYNGCK